MLALINVNFVPQKASAKHIKIRNRNMSEEKKEIETFSFPGEEEQHDIAGLSEEGKVLLNKVSLFEQAKQELIANANFEIEKNDILYNNYMEQLREVVNKKEEEDEPISDKEKN
tara:strand:- start:116 stop:457 length:342 start_codon:yes stop_codon:yes gene_type:complete